MQSLGVSTSFLKNFIKEYLTSKIPVEPAEDSNFLSPDKGLAPPKSGQDAKSRQGDKSSQGDKSRQGEKKEPEFREEPVHMNMFQVVENVIKPLTQVKQSRFVELHHGKVDSAGKPFVKEANVFVSYPWSDDVRTVLQCMIKFAESGRFVGTGTSAGANKECYFWIDALVINQHAEHSAMERDVFEDFTDNTIKGCGSLLQVVTNWTAPLAFRRLWCVWEVFIAERASLPVFMVQPDQEEEALLTNLIDRGISSATNPIAKQGWQKANIGKPNSTMADYRVLVDAIEHYIGFAKLNEIVKQHLKKYLIANLKNRLETNPELNNDPVQLVHYGSLISSLSIQDTKFLIDLFQKCLKLFQEMGKDAWNPDTVMCYTNLGAVCRKGNLPDEARKYLFQALELEEKRIVVERRKVTSVLGDIYFEIGGTLISTGKYEEALKDLLNANAIYEQISEDFDRIMRTQRKIAAVYNKMGLYQIARKVYADIIENSTDPNSMPVALARSAFGDVLVNEGSHYFAIVEMTQAIEDMKAHVGEESVLVAGTLNKRGEVYRQQGKLTEATEDQTHALELLQRIYGKDHPYTGMTLGYLAAIENSKENFAVAFDMYNAAIEVLEGFSSTEDMSYELTVTHCHVAGVYMKMKRYDKALNSLATALSIRSKSVGEDHPDIAPIYFDIAKCHWALHERKDAVNFCSKCLEIELRSLGQRHPKIGTSFCLLGDFYREMKKYEPAHEAYSSAYNIWKQTLQYNHPHLTKLKGTIDATLVQVNAKERRRQELKEAAKPSMKTQIRLSGILKPTAHSMFYSVAKLYDNHHHPNEALAMYRKFLKHVDYALPEEHPRVVTAKTRVKHILRPDIAEETSMIKPRFPSPFKDFI